MLSKEVESNVQLFLGKERVLQRNGVDEATEDLTDIFHNILDRIRSHLNLPKGNRFKSKKRKRKKSSLGFDIQQKVGRPIPKGLQWNNAVQKCYTDIMLSKEVESNVQLFLGKERVLQRNGVDEATEDLTDIFHNILDRIRSHLNLPKGNRFKSKKRKRKKSSLGFDSEKCGLLGTATDWQMLVDLKQKLQFPPQIAVTNQRPDIVIWSASTKQAILLELTVPWEERIEDANERKRLSIKTYLQNVETMDGGFGYFQWKWEAEGLLDSLCGGH
ncbi:unnamed protein product [Mytilus coruscus]|uniref:Uncharacterized protein n=1 Tax=Mytilus coruscus TaxID=42192 RepID=A0A6J8BI02_MYTCO|nr:unnamed protein product [Mytilus coruscus]